MVAAKRGRGARNQAKAKQAEAEAEATSAPSNEPEQQPEEPASEPMAQETEESVAATVKPVETEGNGTVEPEAEQKPEEVKEEKKEEPGQLLVENLPTSLLFNYQDKLREIFSIYGDINHVKRGPITVTELTTTPTLTAIVEFKNKDSLEKATAEDGATVEGNKISVSVQPCTIDTTVLVGVPFEASNEYVQLLFQECGPVAQVQEFSKSKYKILRVTFEQKGSVEKALKLDRELRLNGFVVTVMKYREDDDGAGKLASGGNHKNQNKRAQQQRGGPASSGGGGGGGGGAPVAAPRPANNFRGRGAPFSPRPPFRGGRGGRGGFPARGGVGVAGGFGRASFANDFAMNSYMPPMGGFAMPRTGYLNDGQRPNKRMRNE